MSINNQEFNILNLGDCVKNGKYTIHSEFTKVVNLISRDKNNCKLSVNIVSIVTTYIGSGPNNIVINHPKYIDHIKKIEITDEKLKLNFGNKIVYFDRNKLEIYNSSIKKSIKFKSTDINRDFNKETLLRKLNFLQDILLEISPERSLIFLLNRKLEKNDRKTSFQRKFEEKIFKGVELILTALKSDKISITGLKIIKGLGFGLTPSGDDFLVGMCIALNFKSSLTKTNYSKMVDQIYNTNISENLLSNTFIYYAKEGKVYENFKSLLISLIGGKESEIYDLSRKILDQGATSGTDTLVGFILAMQSIIDL